MKKLKVVIGIAFLLVLIVTLIFVISNCFHFEKSIQPKEIKTLVLAEKFNFEDMKKVGIFYKNPDNNTNSSDIELILTGEDALAVLNSLKNIEYKEELGVMWKPLSVYKIDLFNGTKIVYDNKDNNMVQYQSENEEIFSKFPIEVKNIISKYINKELEKRESLYYTNEIILKYEGQEVKLDNKVAINKIIEECKNNTVIKENLEDSTVEYELIFNDNLKLSVLNEKVNGRNVAKLYNGDKNEIVYISDYLIELLDNIIANTEKNVIAILNTDVIDLKNSGITSKIQDTTIIQEILQHIMCSKINYDNIVNIEEQIDLLKNDTFLNINNNQLIVTIPENGIFNTGFITLNNVTYTINITEDFILLIKSLV